MRHRKSGLKLNRTSSHRNAMFRNMVTSLLKHNRIRTTDAKAKELRSWADHLITLAKRGDLHARRQALSIVREKNVVHQLFEEAKERFGAIAGGYTRVVKLGRRPGDAAPVSIVELVSMEKTKKKKAKKKQKIDIDTKPAVEKDDKPAAADTEAPPSVETAEASPSESAPEPDADADAKESNLDVKAEDAVSEVLPSDEPSDDQADEVKDK